MQIENVRVTIVLNYIPRPEVFTNYGIPFFEKKGIPYDLVLLGENLYSTETLEKQREMMVNQYGVIMAPEGKDLMSILDNSSPNFVISNLNNAYRNPRLFNQIADKFKLVGLSLKQKPKSEKSRVDRVKANPVRIFNFIKKKFSSQQNVKLNLGKFEKIYTSDLTLKNDLLSKSNNLESKVKLSASLEFDKIHMSREACKPLPLKNTCVFLDINLVLHPDTQRLSGNVSFSFEKYAQGLLNVFDKIESELKLKPVICLHPSADMEVYQKYFPSVELNKGNTIEHIYQSSLVLSHASTSTLIAAFYAKPVKVLISDEILAASRYHNAIKQWANELNEIMINMDHLEAENRSDWFGFDQEAYSALTSKYLTPQGVDTPYYQDLLEIS